MSNKSLEKVKQTFSFLFSFQLFVLAVFIVSQFSLSSIDEMLPQNRDNAPDGFVNTAKASDSAVTMADFWNGQATFVFQNHYTFPTDGKYSFTGMNVNSNIVVANGVWYQFSREYVVAKPSYCPNDYARAAVRSSSDHGMTWSAPVTIVNPVPGGPNECASLDGDVYYDQSSYTWHYMFQCLARSGGWQGCHASLQSSDPMQAFTLDANNPVVNNKGLWNTILPGAGIGDEGTFDIVDKINGYFYVTFHGYDGVNGYRGIVKTADFHTWQAVNKTAIFDRTDSNKWNVAWQGGTNGELGSIGGGAANILKEDSYYYEIIEAADRSLGCTAGQNWTFGMMRSTDLTAQHWEQLSGNPTVKDPSDLSNRMCGVQYPYWFKDTNGDTYLLFFRTGSDMDPMTGFYLYKLVANAPDITYPFRWSSGHNFILSDEVSSRGALEGHLASAVWTTGEQPGQDAVQFNNTDTTITLPDNPVFKMNSAFTLEIKTKLNGYPSAKSGLIGGKTNSYWLELYSNGTLCVWVHAGNPIATCAPGPIAIGAWLDIKAVYKAPYLALFINGQMVGINKNVGSGITNEGNVFKMGGNSTSEGYYGSFNGLVDYLRISSVVSQSDADVMVAISPDLSAPVIAKTEIMSASGNVLALAFSVTNAAQMMIAETSGFENASWESYNADKSYTVKSASTKLYIKFKSSNDILSQTVTLDIPAAIIDSPAPAPSVPVIAKAEVKSISGNIVTLALSVTNASQMILADNSNLTGSSWENYAATKTYAKKDNQTQIYLQFKSSAGDNSALIKLGIPDNGGNGSGSNDTSLYPTGTLLKLPNSPRVYVIIDGKKKWISTPEVFEQLGYKWTDIKIITETELNTLPDYEDNLIRQQGDYKVYLVVNGIKRHIPNPEVFLDYGFSWSDIKEVDKTTMDKYKETSLIKESGKNEIYYITNGIRKWIPTMDIFNSYNDKMEDVQIISKKEMESYPLSNLIRLNDSNDIYLIEGNIKKHIPNPTVFNKYKLNWNYVMSVNQTEFSWYKDGGELK